MLMSSNATASHAQKGGATGHAVKQPNFLAAFLGRVQADRSASALRMK
jgi:hypothetical protein